MSLYKQNRLSRLVVIPVFLYVKVTYHITTAINASKNVSCFREYDSAMLLVLPHTLQLPPGQISASVEGYCPGHCTELIFPEGAKIDFAYPHMHYLGTMYFCYCMYFLFLLCWFYVRKYRY